MNSRPVKFGKKEMVNLRPVMNKLIQKKVATGEDTPPESDRTSVFHDISQIKRVGTSGFSIENENAMKKMMENLMKGTDLIGELIEDGNTHLIFKENTIDISVRDVYNTRYILYQRDQTEGQLRIKSSYVTGRIGSSDGDDDRMLTFHQCSFFFCDTREKKEPGEIAYLRAGIRIGCEEKVRFFDCSFIGLNTSQSTDSQQASIADYLAFTDSFSKINLELDNCYFKNLRQALYTNFPVKNLEIRSCTFDFVDPDCLHVTHPTRFILSESQFYGTSYSASNQSHVILVRLFEEDTINPAERSIKANKASVFAGMTGMKMIDNSIVSLQSDQLEGERDPAERKGAEVEEADSHIIEHISRLRERFEDEMHEEERIHDRRSRRVHRGQQVREHARLRSDARRSSLRKT